MAAGIRREAKRMTRERLEAYISMTEEIQELNYKLKHMLEDDSIMGNSTIFDYRSGYPVPQAVVGIDWVKYDRLKSRYETRIRILERECCAVEEYIEGISDSLTRRIFRMYFLEGRKQKEISRAVHLDKSNVSRKIEKFLKSQRTQQMQRYNDT